MDIGTLNEILTFAESEYLVNSPIVESGQRKVYLAQKHGSPDRFILKICPLHPIAVARIQREIKILSETESQYFPKFYFQFFVTDEIISYFIDSFDPKTQVRINELKKMNIRPFLVTVEEHIENVPWQSCSGYLQQEKSLIDFLLQLFDGVQLLWGKKIVHRDLKPENILIRPNMKPVIIDLGIAKSMSEGATIITNPAFPSPCTPRYAAPEQLTNNKAEVTYKTDQFSIGVIAFSMLTGVFPYGSDAEIGIEGVIHNFFAGRVANIKDHNAAVSDGMATFIEKLIKVYPYQRFRTVDEIITTLNEIKGAP